MAFFCSNRGTAWLPQPGEISVIKANPSYHLPALIDGYASSKAESIITDLSFS